MALEVLDQGANPVLRYSPGILHRSLIIGEQDSKSREDVIIIQERDASGLGEGHPSGGVRKCSDLG